MIYDVSLTQFSNYLTKTSRQKVTEAIKIARSLIDPYQPGMDYWLYLRNGVKHVLATTGKIEEIDSIMQDVPIERQSNNQVMINGLKKFWGKKAIKKITIPERSWEHSQILIKMNLEICGECKNTIYFIKFFAHVKQSIRKDETDMMLFLMHEALLRDIEKYKKLGKKVVVGVLDVVKGKLHTYRDAPLELSNLVKIEAEGLYKYLSINEN